MGLTRGCDFVCLYFSFNRVAIWKMRRNLSQSCKIFNMMCIRVNAIIHFPTGKFLQRPHQDCSYSRSRRCFSHLHRQAARGNKLPYVWYKLAGLRTWNGWKTSLLQKSLEKGLGPSGRRKQFLNLLLWHIGRNFLCFNLIRGQNEAKQIQRNNYAIQYEALTSYIHLKIIIYLFIYY